MFRIGRRRCAAGLIFLAACTGFSADPAPAGQPGDPAGADGGSQGAVDGKGVVATIALKVEAGKKTWVRNRANSVKFTLVRGENARGRVAVAVRGLPTGSTVTAATLEDGVTTGTVTFQPSADAPVGDQALTLDGALDGDATARASVPLDGFMRGAPGDLDTTFATNGVITIPAAAVSAVAPDGRLFTFRFDQTTERYLADGRLDVGFATNVSVRPSACRGTLTRRSPSWLASAQPPARQADGSNAGTSRRRTRRASRGRTSAR